MTRPLKWAGGKAWQVPILRTLWTGQRLIEPFCGGLAVTLGLHPSHALLNDVNPHLINFYRWLQRGITIPMPMKNDELEYYECRAAFNALIAQQQHETQLAALLFYYLNRTGYNGLCRFNKAGEFNVPFGEHKTINYIQDFSPYRDVLSAWDFQTGDFARIFLADGDFVYADPPYDVEFTTYSSGGFPWSDQVRCATWLTQHRGPVVLVNQATPRIIALYQQLGYDVRYLDAPRRISCTGDRQSVKEIFATRNLARHVTL